MAKIEMIYQATIHYEANPDIVDAIENKAFDFGGDLDVETMCGNAACSPYITAKGRTIKAVTVWAGKVERYINRRKGATLETAS